jgi:hypothetical protein
MARCNGGSHMHGIESNANTNGNGSDRALQASFERPVGLYHLQQEMRRINWSSTVLTYPRRARLPMAQNSIYSRLINFVPVSSNINRFTILLSRSQFSGLQGQGHALPTIDFLRWHATCFNPAADAVVIGRLRLAVRKQSAARSSFRTTSSSILRSRIPMSCTTAGSAIMTCLILWLAFSASPTRVQSARATIQQSTQGMAHRGKNSQLFSEPSTIGSSSSNL